MQTVELNGLIGGALQEKFSRSFERVIRNLQDVNTSFKTKRKITIQLDFTQNETRDDVHVDVSIVEKLAPQASMKTAFLIGKDLHTGDIYAEEYGKQIKGQMKLDDYAVMGDAGTGSRDADVPDAGAVVDFRKASAQ